MSAPGIGPIISNAMVAAIGSGDAFTKGRDFAAWLGLVPKLPSARGWQGHRRRASSAPAIPTAWRHISSPCSGEIC